MNLKPCSLFSAKRMSLISSVFIFENVEWSSLPVGGYQCVRSDTQDTRVPAFHTPDGLKPNLRPWLIEEGMTYISQGEKNHLPRMREKRPRAPRKSVHKQWASSLLWFLFHSSKTSKFSPQLGPLHTPLKSCPVDLGSKHILNQLKSK